MGIGPFTTYAPPGVYTKTVTEPVVGQLLGGLRIPVLIGTGQESLTQTDFELVRGSSSVADTPIFAEDVAGQFVLGGSPTNPTLGPADGVHSQFRVRNYPIVDGDGIGRVTFDVSKVSVRVNGQQVVVSQLDGPNGLVSILVPPQPTDVVQIDYFFHRKDTRVTDDVSAQVTAGAAILIAPKAETYNIVTGVSDKLLVTVNDAVQGTITLLPGSARLAADVANDINAAGVTGLTSSVHVDAQGLAHIQLIAQGNVQIGSGNANGALGFNPGDYTNRNKTFRVFNGPIVDGSDGGITTTDPSKVTVVINGTQVLAKSVDGKNQAVTLVAAPTPGATVTIAYYFNTFQDTFDYLPNSNIVTVGNVGIAPGRRDYLNGPDFVVINDGDQSKIQWGTAFQVVAGEKTGTNSFDSTQITGLLVDDRVFGLPCTRFTDPATAQVSETRFVMSLSPTTGNGRDTPLGQSLYQTVTNGRIDLPTNRPDLVVVHVGKNFRDAMARPAVTVLAVDSATNTFTLRDPVPADYVVFATFWYNRIGDDVFTFSVVNGGPSGVGQYKIHSKKTDQDLLGVTFGTKTGLSQTIQWPSGDEVLPDAFHSGDGTPVSETVTVTFDSSLDPAQHASFSNAGQSPYDIYAYTRVFGGVVVDGNPAVSVDLSLPYLANILGQPVTEPLSFLATDFMLLQVDGVVLAPIALTGLTTMAGVVTAINAVVDADVHAHADGSPTFSSTAPNNLASAVAYGSDVILKVSGRNLQSSTNGLVSSVLVLVPTAPGQSDGSRKTGLAPNLSGAGSFSAINQAARLVGAQPAPFAIQTGVNDSIQLTVDGSDFSAVLPSGTATSLEDVVTAINDAYMAVASPADIATYTADLVALANNVKAEYSLHIASTTYHLVTDGVDTITSPNATDLATAVTLLNELKIKYNAHIGSGTYHQLVDSTNVEALSAAIDLQTALALGHDLKEKYNAHLSQLGVHGHDDTTNVESLSTIALLVQSAQSNGGLVEITTTVPHGLSGGDKVFIANVVGTTEANGGWVITLTGASTFTLNTSTFTNAYVSGGNVSSVSSEEALLNDLKAKFNAHLSQTGVHLANDVLDVVSTANASDAAAGPYTTAAALANSIKAKFNVHIASTVYHNVADTTNAIGTADATAGSLASVFALATAIKAAFNAHRLQLQGAYHVHGTDDTVNLATALLSQLVAQSGLGINAGKLVLTSRVNSSISGVTFKSTSTSGTVLGFVPGISAGRTQPSAASIAGALNDSGPFGALAVAYSVQSAGLGSFLEINSRTSGSASTIAFSSAVNTAFIPDTGLGIVPGSSSAIGQSAQSGFRVTSSDAANGSSGTGVPGQTYTDAKTGLRFSVLPATAGDYTSGGKFTLVVKATYTADASIPIKEIPGVEVTVYNTIGMNPGTTATLSTFSRTGTHPKVGDVYYASYQFAKTDLSTALFRDLKSIQQNFGTPTPDNPLALGARLALLNGAVLIGLKQVLRAAGSSQANLGSFTAAIDEQQKPMSGNVKPDVITPLATDPNIFAYLNQHCIFMSSPRQEGERIGVIGPAVGTTALGVQAIAKGLGSELMVLTYPDSYIVTVTDNQGNSSQQLVDASFMAAAVAGSTCNPSIDVATPLTRRQILGFTQSGRILDPTEANQIAVAGVSIVEQSDQGLRIRHGLTTNPATVITRTPSVTLTIQFVQQAMRRVLDPYIGQKFTGALLKSAESAMTGAFANMIDQQIVTKVAGIAVAVDPNDPTIMSSEAIYVPVFPLEYIVSTLQIRIRL